MEKPPVVLCHMCGGVVLRTKANIMYVTRGGEREERGCVCQKCTDGIAKEIERLESKGQDMDKDNSKGKVAPLLAFFAICLLVGMLFGGLLALLATQLL